MTQIEGLTQGIRHGQLNQRLHFKLRHQGVEIDPDLTTTTDKAEIDLGAVMRNFDSVLEFNVAGPEGEKWFVACVHTGFNALIVDLTIKAFVFTYNSGVTTVSDLEALVTALAGGLDVIDIKTPGTGAAILVDVLDTLHPDDGYLSQGHHPTVTIYDPIGKLKLAATKLTRVSGSPWWYVDIDASAVTTWELNYNYRAQIDFDYNDQPVQDNIMVDVIKWPFNEPLVTTEEIDRAHPAWAGKRPGTWQDWVEPIEMAHLELSKELRNTRDSKGRYVYPHRIMDRGQVRMLALAMTEAKIAESIRMKEETVNAYKDKAIAAAEGFNKFHLDIDSDMVIDTGEGVLTGPSFSH